MSKVELPIEQDGYNAYGEVEGKRVPVLSTSMGNCWNQDDQRDFCGHLVTAVNYHERLVEALSLAVDFINKHPGDPDITAEQVEAWQKLVKFDPEKLLAELDTKKVTP